MRGVAWRGVPCLHLFFSYRPDADRIAGRAGVAGLDAVDFLAGGCEVEGMVSVCVSVVKRVCVRAHGAHVRRRMEERVGRAR